MAAAVDIPATYLRGRAANTPARSFPIRSGTTAAAGFCPETVLEAGPDRVVSTRPLAGTRALGADACVPASVVANELLSVEERGSVQHLASRVSGTLSGGQTAWDALEAVFPGVTASGIPKAEAREYIARTEPSPRGLYAGVVLTASSDGALDAGLVLRAVFETDGRWWLRAGAGIIAESRPDREYEETCEKLRSVAPYLVPGRRRAL